MFLYRLSSGISGVKWRRLNITVLKSIELAWERKVQFDCPNV
jgi:hypothetical protein